MASPESNDKAAIQELNNDPIWKKFGFRVLHERGVLETGSSRRPLDDIHAHEKTIKKITELEITDGFGIHPIFQFDRFTGITQDDYDKALMPVVRLATCLLTDLSVLPFFNHLLNRKWQRIDNAKAEKDFNQELWSFGRDETPITDNEFKQTWIQLRELALSITWNLIPEGDPNYSGAYMYTHKHSADKSKPKTTYASRISFRSSYIRVLKGELNPQFLPATANCDKDDSRLRMRVLMACTMAHEVCHALVNRHCAKDPKAYDKDNAGNYIKHPLPAEPFWRDDNTSELGYAYNQYTTGGILRPIGTLPAEVRAPAGAYIYDFKYRVKKPTKWSRFMIKDPVAELGLTEWLRSAVSMNHMQNLYNQKFWEFAVARFGRASLVPKSVGCDVTVYAAGYAPEKSAAQGNGSSKK